LKKLRKEEPSFLERFVVNNSTRLHHFWQRNSLPFEITNEETLLQKLRRAANSYIHNNPMQEHWSLVEKPEDYTYSSAKFYFEGKDDFGILTHWNER
jgi:hypothetical protein